jgi:hypothetical protein
MIQKTVGRIRLITQFPVDTSVAWGTLANHGWQSKQEKLVKENYFDVSITRLAGNFGKTERSNRNQQQGSKLVKASLGNPLLPRVTTD